MAPSPPARLAAVATATFALLVVAAGAFVFWPRSADLDLALTEPLPPHRRPRLAAFDLPTLDGGRLSSGDLAGRVTLVNAWASWCAPCREELPALDSLARALADEGLAYVTLNDDVSEAAAAAFARDVGVGVPVALGGGRLKRRLGYWGLPTTWLLDARGRVIYVWMGYGGPVQLDAITRFARAEIRGVVGAEEAAP